MVATATRVKVATLLFFVALCYGLELSPDMFRMWFASRYVWEAALEFMGDGVFAVLLSLAIVAICPTNLELVLRKHAHYWHERTVTYARRLGAMWLSDQSPGFWVEHLNAFEEAHGLQGHKVQRKPRPPRESTLRKRTRRDDDA